MSKGQGNNLQPPKKKKKKVNKGNKQEKQNNILKNALTSLGSVQRFLSPNSYMCFIKAPNYYMLVSLNGKSKYKHKIQNTC